jgi:FMN phosphatase YigB (HAD superfamily)
MDPNTTKLICFDLWETLVNEPFTTEDCWKPFALAYPRKFSWTKIHELIARILHGKNQPTEKSVYEILKLFDVADRALAEEISGRWNYSCDQVNLYPEALEALENLRRKDKRLGLITNTSRYGWEAIQRKFSLGGYFDYLSLSFEQGHVKPESEIFEFIERESGIANSEIIMIGDSYENDFISPRKRGWMSILLDRQRTNKYPEAKPVAHSLHELATLLKI